LARADDHRLRILAACLGFFAITELGNARTISFTVAIVVGWLPRAQDRAIAAAAVDNNILEERIGKIIVNRVGWRFEQMLLAAFLCFRALAPFGLFGTVPGAIAIVFIRLARAEDHWHSILATILS
jgi:hypothetical protein